jgi:hypothetical protein
MRPSSCINGKVSCLGHALSLAGNLGMRLVETRCGGCGAGIGTEFSETEMYPEPRTVNMGRPHRIDIDT